MADKWVRPSARAAETAPSLRSQPAPGDVSLTLGHNGTVVYTDPANAKAFLDSKIATLTQNDPNQTNLNLQYDKDGQLSSAPVPGETVIRQQYTPAAWPQPPMPQPSIGQLAQPQVEQMNFPVQAVTVAHPVTGNQVQTTPEAAQALIQAGHAVAVPNG